MAFRKFNRAKTVTWSAGSDSGAELNLAAIPATEAGRHVYVDALKIRVQGTLTADGTGSSIVAGAVTRLINRIELGITGLPRQLVSITSLNMARLHRLRTAGVRLPGTGAVSIGSSATSAVDFTIPVKFTQPGARRPLDFAIPAALFADSTFKLTYGQLSDVATHLASFTGTITVTAQCHTRGELVVPSMTTLESLDFAASANEILPPRGDFKVLELGVARQGAASLATTEHTKAGIKFGAQVMSDDSQSVSDIYAAWNEYATTAFTDHTVSTPAIDECLPIVWAADDTNGDRQTLAPDGSAQMRYYVDTATNGYTMLRRSVWKDGTWRATVEARLGIPPGSKSKAVTASKAGTNSAYVASTLPKKRIA